MRIPKVVKSGTKLNTKSIMLIAIAATLLSNVSSVVVHATQTPLIDGSTIDVSGSAHGDQIIAGIEYGASPVNGGGADPECEWSESMPRDASATGPGQVVTKHIGSTTTGCSTTRAPLVIRPPPTTGSPKSRPNNLHNMPHQSCTTIFRQCGATLLRLHGADSSM